MNDCLRKPGPPQADLSALRIVEKEQASTRCRANAKQRQFKDHVLSSYPQLFFCYEPLCTSLPGFRRQLFMERINGGNSPNAHLKINHDKKF
jgi:hypothetical protein